MSLPISPSALAAVEASIAVATGAAIFMIIETSCKSPLLTCRSGRERPLTFGVGVRGVLMQRLAARTGREVSDRAVEPVLGKRLVPSDLCAVRALRHR